MYLTFRRLLGHLGPPGASWSHLESLETNWNIWNYLEPSGPIESHLEAPESLGAIGSHLGCLFFCWLWWLIQNNRFLDGRMSYLVTFGPRVGGHLPGGRSHNCFAVQKMWVDFVSLVIFWSLLGSPGAAWNHLETLAASWTLLEPFGAS
jgi:hypothetical protein